MLPKLKYTEGETFVFDSDGEDITISFLQEQSGVSVKQRIMDIISDQYKKDVCALKSHICLNGAAGVS